MQQGQAQGQGPAQAQGHMLQQFKPVMQQQGSYFMSPSTCNIMNSVPQPSAQFPSSTMMNMLSGRDAPPAVWNQGGGNNNNSGSNFQGGNYFQGSSGGSTYGKQAVDAAPIGAFTCPRDSFDKSLSFAMNNGLDSSGLNSVVGLNSANTVGCMDLMAPKPPRSDSFCQDNPFAGDWETVSDKRTQLAALGRQPSSSQGFGAFNAGFAVNNANNVQWN